MMTDELRRDVPNIPTEKLNTEFLDQHLFVRLTNQEIAKIIRAKSAHVKQPSMVVYCSSEQQARELRGLLLEAAVKIVGSEIVYDDAKAGEDTLAKANIVVFVHTRAMNAMMHLRQLGQSLFRYDGKERVLVLDFPYGCQQWKVVSEIKIHFPKRSTQDSQLATFVLDCLRPHNQAFRLVDLVSSAIKLAKPEKNEIQVGGRMVSTSLLLVQLHNKAMELKLVPTHKELKDDPLMADPWIYTKYFGNLSKALEAAGIALPLANEELLALLVNAYGKRSGLGKLVGHVWKNPNIASLETYVARFGSVEHTCRLAGLKTKGLKGKKNISDGELIESLQCKILELGRNPTNREVALDDEMVVPSTYYKRFGGLSKACIIANKLLENNE